VDKTATEKVERGILWAWVL